MNCNKKSNSFFYRRRRKIWSWSSWKASLVVLTSSLTLRFLIVFLISHSHNHQLLLSLLFWITILFLFLCCCGEGGAWTVPNGTPYCFSNALHCNPPFNLFIIYSLSSAMFGFHFFYFLFSLSVCPFKVQTLLIKDAKVGFFCLIPCSSCGAR